jgi:hypothetical protein
MGATMKIDYDVLDENPEFALCQILQQLDDQIGEILNKTNEENNPIWAYVEYINIALESAETLGINDFDFYRVPEYKNAFETFTKFNLEKDRYIVRHNIKKYKSKNQFSVELDANTKVKIHHYVAQIRNIIAECDLTERKKNSLYTKINAFAADVDRARTRFDSAMSMLIDLADVARHGTEAVQPLTDFVNSITALFGAAKSSEPEAIQLPKPEEPKRIEGPKPTEVDQNSPVTPSSDLDDGVPF